jgi:CheY-like chemotaxis protein
MSACGVRLAHPRGTTRVGKERSAAGQWACPLSAAFAASLGAPGDGVCWNRQKESVKPTHPLVSIVDDDESVSQSLPDLLRELGFSAQAFSSAEEFLASDRVSWTACLLLDVALPGMSGPDLLRELRVRGLQIPIIFITAQTGETLRQRLLEQGAVACLFKPFSESALLKALKSALQTS